MHNYRKLFLNYPSYHGNWDNLEIIFCSYVALCIYTRTAFSGHCFPVCLSDSIDSEENSSASEKDESDVEMTKVEKDKKKGKEALTARLSSKSEKQKGNYL